MPRISFKSRLLVLVIAGISMAVLYHIITAGRKKSEVYVVMRYDDYSTGSSGMVEEAILKSLRDYRFSCSFGVIPYSPDSTNKQAAVKAIDSAKIRLVLNEVSEGRIEICQHGYSHTSYSTTPPFSEFKNMPLKEQYERISAGKALLETSFQTTVGTFIPPWNSYDENTLKVLAELKESNISADQLQISDSDKFCYIPFTGMLSDVNMLAGYTQLPTQIKRNAIVLLLHDYDFKEINPATGITTIDEFNSAMKIISAKKWHVVSIRDAAKLGLFDSREYKMNRLKISLLSHLHSVIKPRLLFHKLNAYNYLYLSPGHIIALLLFTVFYYFIIFLLFTEIVYVTISGFLVKNQMKYVYWAGSGILIIILSVVFWKDDHTYGTSEILVLLFMVSLLFASFIKASPEKLPRLKLKPGFINKPK